MARRRISYEWRVPLLSLLSALPAIVVALTLVWIGDFSTRLKWTLSLATAGGWLGFWIASRERLIRPLQTMSNMVAALQEGDYTMRARLGRPDDSLGLVAHEVNQLGETLREQRLEVLEATALLRRVMAEIDVAVFAFDSDDKLVLANRAGERLLDRSEDSMMGRRADSLHLAELLAGPPRTVTDMVFPSGASRWEMRVSQFRQEGKPHRLLVVSDLSRVLREEERTAWQRLVRVLGHEINNSLAPIQSIAQSLSASARRQFARTAAAERETAPEDGELAEDFVQGLNVISSRSEALSRFLSSYARLARLPPPSLGELDVGEWVERVVGLETRIPIEIARGPDLKVAADGDQLDQLLINLVDNAVDAVEATDGGVRVGWKTSRRQVNVWVEDDGPGLADTSNLFVPFYTTKETGSGIGLVLCREIAEAHRGSLTLRNRTDATGCIASLTLPMVGSLG
ncbi:MAG: ATP-binding protein [Gemmatimonadetes bacterium]|nr:ATP-binding protein [Gemmatimonadota bacterium]